VGIRAQITMQVFKMAGMYGGVQRHVLLHLTPLRASRSLAMRYMALHSELPLEKFIVVTCAGVTSDSQGRKQFTFATNSGSDILGGATRVLVVPFAEDKPVTDDERPHLQYHMCYSDDRVRLLEKTQ